MQEHTKLAPYFDKTYSYSSKSIYSVLALTV